MRIYQAEEAVPFWSRNGKHGVEISFYCREPGKFFITDKQMQKLISCSDQRFYVLLDDEHFVWSSTDADLKWMQSKFNAVLIEKDAHIDELENPKAVEHDELKN